MASVIVSYCTVFNKSSSMDCRRPAPFIDIISGLALLVIGALVAAGIIHATAGAMCAIFSVGCFLLGSGLVAFQWWYKHC